MESLNQRILGLDPGLSATGYALIDAAKPGAKPIAIGDVRTRARDPIGVRLQAIHGAIAEIVERHPPAMVVAEALFTRVNVKTVLLMAQARGVAILAATARGAALHEYAPAEIKKLITGSGRAGKAQVMAMVSAQVKLPQRDLSDHATDALAAALCHCRHLALERAGGAVKKPARRRTSRQQWQDFVDRRR
jgi:crossover junction endodeoxyribonuclease RuvC